MRALKVSPERVTFRDIEVNETDSIDVWAQNKSNRPLSIRFYLDKDSPFQIPVNKPGVIPVGLEAKTTITYKSTNSEIVKGTLYVQCPNETVEIPIIAYPCCSSIVFSETEIDVGEIPMSAIINKTIVVRNYGSQPGNYVLTTDRDNITFTQDTGYIPASSSTEIVFTLKPIDLGPFETTITMEVDTAKEPIPKIIVRGSVMKSTLKFLFEGKPVTELDFGKIFIGQKRVLQMTIKNPEKTKRSFVIKKPYDPQAIHDEENIFTSVPTEGIVPPQSEIVVEFIFSPPKVHFIDDNELMYTSVVPIKIIETEQTFEFKLSGLLVGLFFELSPIDFDFGRQFVNTKVTKKLLITNRSQHLPISYHLPNIAQWRFEKEEGTVLPGKTKQIGIVFYPRNLGDFQEENIITICNGLASKTITLCGVSVKKDLEGKKFQRKELYEIDPTANYMAHHPDTRFGLYMDQIKRKEELREEFHSYITDSATKREEKRVRSELVSTLRLRAREYLHYTREVFNEEDVEDLVERELKMSGNDTVNLGFDHAEGLKPPDPGIPKGNAQLPVLDPARFELIGRSQPKTPKEFKSSRVISTRFRSKPSTPPEINECSRTLTPAQQLSVLFSNSTINFGIVSVLATESKVFTITNNLQQHIFVEFSFDAQELKRSSPSSQVIPPLQTATFDITFLATEPISFVHTVFYTINKVHQYQLNVCAQAVPIETRLSKTIVEFGFGYETVEPSVHSFVTIFNNSNANAEYTWRGFQPPFEVAEAEGIVPPNSNKNVEIWYTPGTSNHAESVVSLFVVGGSTRQLKLVGDAGRPKVNVARKNVDFELIPINILKTVQVKIKNSGSDDAIFTVNLNDRKLKVMPMSGRLAVDEIKVLQFSIKCDQPGEFSIPLSISIAGSNPIAMTAIGSAQLPSIGIDSESLELGRLFIGSSARRKITIRNTGKIPSLLYLDLSPFDAFRIEYKAELGHTSSADHENSIQVVDHKSLPEASKVFQPQNAGELKGKAYKMSVIEESQVEFTLIYEPKIVEDFSFELPLTVVMADKCKLPIVSGESIHAPLRPSTSIIDFGISPLYDPVNPNNRPSVRELVLRNEYTKSVSYRFATSNMSKLITLDKPSGTIDYLATASVFFTYRPTQMMPFNDHVPLYVITDAGEAFIAEIQLTGVGSSRVFKTSTDYVCLQPVPLNTVVKRRIYVENTCFVQGTLKAEMPVVEKNFPLKIEFPEGNKLAFTKAKIPLDISFEASKPTSFTTVVALTSDKGQAYSFQVTATTDNSIFTLYPTMSINDYTVDISNMKPPTISLSTMKMDFISEYLSAPDILDVKGMKSKLLNETISFVKRFLNNNVLNTHIAQFPTDLANDHALMSEMILNFGGKKPSKAYSSKKEEDPIMIKLQNLKTDLQYLMSVGAHVANIKPEFLLSKDDFMTLMRRRITLSLFGIDYYGAPELSTFPQDVVDEFSSAQSFVSQLMPRVKAAEDVFPELSKEAWTLLVFQLIKLFYISNVDPSKFQITPGVNETLKALKGEISNQVFNDINMIYRGGTQSNVFSATESVLLKWLSLSYAHENNISARPVLDYNELKNPIFFGSLLKAHLGEEQEETKHDISKLIDCIRLAKLCLFIIPDDITKGDQCTLACILCQLYLALPHYLPTSTLEFNCQLNKVITQTVTVSNPSAHELFYQANIEGSSNFRCPQPVLYLGPHGAGDIAVEYNARTHIQERATLSLVPSKPRPIASSRGGNGSGTARRQKNSKINISKPLTSVSSIKRLSAMSSTASIMSILPTASNLPPAFATTIVFELTSKVSYGVPQGTVEIEGPIYEPNKTKIEIKNCVNKAGHFKLYYRFFAMSPDSFSSKSILNQQMAQFIQDPSQELEYAEQDNAFLKQLMKHSPFLFDTREIDFKDDKETKTINVEYIPITLNSYRCLLMFKSDTAGEFVYEIQGRTKLPSVIDLNTTIKTESKKKTTSKLILEPTNFSFYRALAYAHERLASFNAYVSDRKFRELVNFRTREIANLHSQVFSQIELNIELSSQFYTAPEKITLIKGGLKDRNTLPLTFCPTKPGDYPCRIVASSEYDIRVYSVKGIGLASTKNCVITINTIAGRKVIQELPFENPSNKDWEFRVSSAGAHGFVHPGRFVVQANSTFQMPLEFESRTSGEFGLTITVTNMTKEAVAVFKVTAKVEDPLAEKKVFIKCNARKTHKEVLQMPPIVQNGLVTISTDIPILQIPKSATFQRGKPTAPIEATIYATRSGVSAGTITITDPSTKFYVWFVVEIQIDHPDPEETIEVKANARTTQTIKIPIKNSKAEPITFSVEYSDGDLIGPSELIVPPDGDVQCEIVFAPLIEETRYSSVSFFNDNDGEFIYLLHIEVFPPEINKIAPLSAPVGKYAQTSIVLENPFTKQTQFTISNENEECFQILSRSQITLKPREKKMIDVRYIPSKVGVKEETTVIFKSEEAGEWIYQMIGVGKPPQPLSPIIVEGRSGLASSVDVEFRNPFPYPSHFTYALTTDTPVFSLLTKGRKFDLNGYGSSFQIPISFNPEVPGQYYCSVIFSNGSVQWTVPVIGNATDSAIAEAPRLTGRANTEIIKRFELPLVGEREEFNPIDYVIKISYQKGSEWLENFMELKATQIFHDEKGIRLGFCARMSPRRPIETEVGISVQNLLGQQWRFTLEIVISHGDFLASITMEAILNKTTTARITVPEVFSIRTPYHAYFANGSAAEFSLSSSKGVIEPVVLKEETELPFDIIFAPKMYGKVMRGVLVVDTLERQILFEVTGRIPAYKPPTIQKAIQRGKPNAETIQRWNDSKSARRRQDESLGNVLKPRASTVIVRRHQYE